MGRAISHGLIINLFAPARSAKPKLKIHHWTSIRSLVTCGVVALAGAILAEHGPVGAEEYEACYRGKAAQNSENHDLAIEQYTLCLDFGELKPGNRAVIYNNRGNAYFNKGAHDLAIADYGEAIGLNPQYDVAYNNQGNAFRAKGALERAIESFNKAIDLNRGYVYAYNNRGIVHDEMRAYQRAIADFDEAVLLDPSYAHAFNNRSVTYYNMEAFGRAIENFDRAIEIDPAYAVAFNNRGNAYRARHSYELAIADYYQAVRLDPRDALAFNNRGRARFFQEKFSRAIPDFVKATELIPDDIYPALWLYVSRARDGHEDRLALTPHLGVEAWPGPVAAMLLSDISTEELLAAAHDPDPRVENENLCEAHFFIGQHLLLQGREEAAVEHFNLAIDSDVKSLPEYTGAKAELKRMGY